MARTKKIKKAFGIGIIATLFITIFVWTVQDSSLEIALKSWGTTLGLLIVVGVGVVLATSD